ncbi:hypothetical protein B0H14DRAFT_562338 [Mycena olivaceomarginata]|nr:hypothetical protein B0H14DRAFT_562338 [Mycena olivaceomarginata]
MRNDMRSRHGCFKDFECLSRWPLSWPLLMNGPCSRRHQFVAQATNPIFPNSHSLKAGKMRLHSLSSPFCSSHPSQNMSNQPNHAPFTPLYSGVPEIHYDGKGNAFYLAPDGRWLPYNGPLTQLMQQAAPAPPFTQTPLNDKSRGGPDSPIEHAFPADQYQFALRPSGTAPHAIPIDPALIPLPRGPDIDLNLKGLGEQVQAVSQTKETHR